MKTTISWNNKLLKHVLIHKLAMIILIPIILVAGVFGVEKFGTPANFVSTSELVQKDNQVSQISAYQNYIQTSQFKNELNNKIRSSQWHGTKASRDYTISITSAVNSPFFDIAGSSSNPYFSKFVTAKAADVFQSQISQFLSGANISLLSVASLNTNPVQANYKKTLLAAAGVGFVISISFAFYLDICVGKLGDEDYLLDVHGLSKLGTLKLKSE